LKMEVLDETNELLASVNCGESASPFSVRSD